MTCTYMSRTLVQWDDTLIIIFCLAFVVCDFCILIYLNINPLSPHDALKHHFTSMKTDLIFLQQRVLERDFP